MKLFAVIIPRVLRLFQKKDIAVSPEAKAGELTDEIRRYDTEDLILS